MNEHDTEPPPSSTLPPPPPAAFSAEVVVDAALAGEPLSFGYGALPPHTYRPGGHVLLPVIRTAEPACAVPDGYELEGRWA